MLALMAVFVLVVFGLGLGYYVLNGRLDTKQQELADVQQQVTQLETQVAALDQFAQLSAQRQRAETNVQQIYAGRTLVATVLDELSLVIPDDAWFQSLALQTTDPVDKAGTDGSPPSAAPGLNTMTIEGNTYSFEGVAQVLVRLGLISSLTDLSLVSAGAPRGTVDPSIDVKGFTVTASVINDQAPDTPLPLSQAEVVSP